MSDSELDVSELDVSLEEKEALEEIMLERLHQVSKGYDAPHDDEHVLGEIAQGAAFYAMNSAAFLHSPPHKKRNGAVYVGPNAHQKHITADACWPWEASQRKIHNSYDSLVVAGAMLVAEIARRKREMTSIDLAQEEALALEEAQNENSAQSSEPVSESESEPS